MLWDLGLYVPTVVALATIALSMWYGGSQSWAYLLFFLASFFLIAGANRIVSGRLMLLPSSPTALEVDKKSVKLGLRNGEKVELVKDLRFFADYAGKSIGLTGMDLNGKRRQYVFHKGQFPDEGQFSDLKSLLSVFR